MKPLLSRTCTRLSSCLSRRVLPLGRGALSFFGGKSRRSAALLLLLAGGMLLPLSSCGGGGGGGSAKSSKSKDGNEEFYTSSNYLTDPYFMPKHMVQAELHVENSAMVLHLVCLTASPSAACVRGSLDAAQSYLQYKGESEQHLLTGEWEQYGSLNTVNSVNGILVTTADGSPISVEISGMGISITGREDDPDDIDNTIILKGKVSHGSLTIDDKYQSSFKGSSVNLIYTIASGSVNAETHGSSQAD